MPHTQTHRTVSLLISTRTGAHTCTHTQAPVVTVHGHFPPVAQTQPPLFLAHTRAHFRHPQWPQLHPTFLEVDGLRGPYTQDTGPGMRSLRAVCLPVSSLSRKQDLVQLMEVQLTEDSQQMWQAPSLPIPLPQQCSVFVGPLP